MAAQRDERIDAIKGVLISLVVLGHCCVYGTHDAVKLTVANWVYLFHMPFFVFLSGFFTHVYSHSFWKGVLAVLESYIVFQLIKGLLYNYSFVELLTVPAPMMWYLWALVIWRCFYWLLMKLPQTKQLRITVLTLLFAMGLGVGFFPGIGKPFALSRVIVFAPFFYFGTLLAGFDFVTWCKKIPRWLSVLILLTAIGIVVLASSMKWINVRETVRGASSYAIIGSNMVGFVGRLVYYGLAVVLSIAVTSVVDSSKLLCTVGKDSLKYYLFHGLALPVILFLKLPWNWYWAIVWWVLIMIVIFLFNKTRLSDFAIRPVYFMTELFKTKRHNNKIQNV